MTRYAAFLRGINVNGITIRMADLKTAFEDLGFQSVKTVLASGNVRFETERADQAELKREIEAKLAQTFGYQAWIVLMPHDTVQRILNASPFERGREDRHAYAVLASDQSALDGLLRLQGTLDPEIERVHAGDGVLFWEVQKGRTTDSVFGKELGRARYKSATTTRNLNTLEKLL